MSLGYKQVREVFSFAPPDDHFCEGSRCFGEEPVCLERGLSFPEMLGFASPTAGQISLEFSFWCLE